MGDAGEEQRGRGVRDRGGKEEGGVGVAVGVAQAGTEGPSQRWDLCDSCLSCALTGLSFLICKMTGLIPHLLGLPATLPQGPTHRHCLRFSVGPTPTYSSMF